MRTFLRSDATRHVLALVLLALWGVNCLASRPWVEAPLPAGAAGPSPRLIEDDPYFHFRHALYASSHFPHVLRNDPWSAFPGLDRGVSQGGFDLLLAGAAWLRAGGRPDEAQVMQVCAWSSVLLSLVALVLFYALTSRWLGPSPALVALALAVLYPSALADYSLLGFGDHHVFEVLLLWLTMAGLQRSWQLEQPTVKANLLCALPLAVFLFSWPGAPMHLVGTGIFWGAAWRLRSAAEPPGRTYGLALTALTLPVAVLEPSSIPVLDFIPWYAISLAILALGPPLLGWARATRARPSTRVLLLASGAAVLAALSQPLALQALQKLFEQRSSTILEQSSWGLDWMARQCPPLVLLAALGAVSARRASERSLAVLTLGGWNLLLWAWTGDFAYQAMLLVAYLAALGWSVMGRARWGVLLPLLGWPFWVGTAPPRAAQGLTTPSVRLGVGVYDDALAELCGHLRSQGAQRLEADQAVLANWSLGHILTAMARHPVLFSSTESEEQSSLLLSPSERDFERQLGPHPPGLWLVDCRTATDQFLTQAQLAGSPAAELVTRPGPSLDGHPLPLFGPRYQQAMIVRAYCADGAGLRHWALVDESLSCVLVGYLIDPSAKGWTIGRRSLQMHDQDQWGWAETLVEQSRESPVRVGPSLIYQAEKQPELKLFRRVSGYRLAGRAAPGQQVRARLPLEMTTTGRRWVYQQTAWADPRGDYAMIVPYSSSRTTSEGSFVRATGPYALVVGERVQSREVP